MKDSKFARLAQTYTRSRIHEAELKAHGQKVSPADLDLTEKIERKLRTLDYERAERVITRTQQVMATIRYNHSEDDCGVCVGRYLAKNGLAEYPDLSFYELVNRAGLND
jgi:hypothetical protein